LIPAQRNASTVDDTSLPFRPRLTDPLHEGRQVVVEPAAQRRIARLAFSCDHCKRTCPLEAQLPGALDAVRVMVVLDNADAQTNLGLMDRDGSCDSTSRCGTFFTLSTQG
jgi:hypothetical protein